jgi:hypothetical protein
MNSFYEATVSYTVYYRLASDWFITTGQKGLFVPFYESTWNALMFDTKAATLYNMTREIEHMRFVRYMKETGYAE